MRAPSDNRARRQIALLALIFILGLTMTTNTDSPARAGRHDGLAVEVQNASEPVLCAEKDNIAINFTSPDVRAFRIEAAHPSYIHAIDRDSFEADWTDCDMSGDPVHQSSVKVPTRRTIYEEPEIWLVAWTMPTFWRPSTAIVRVGERVERDVHLLQVWTIRPMGGEEVLVLYPQDGYWRIRPKAPSGRAPTAFGSSLLIGPVEVDGRPIVRFEEVVFDPAARSFTLKYALGGSGTVRMATVDENRHTLEVAFDRPVVGRPFAALRSMYVTEFNNDVQRIAVREADAKGWRESPILEFGAARATAAWMGRTSLSRHNTSAPDIVLNGFAPLSR